MKLGIFGWPVGHSLSPRMHEAALEALGLRDWTYQAIEVAPEALAPALERLREPGWRGGNLTLPHKEAAARLCDQLSAEAAQLGAVNTIVVENGRLVGHNTDVHGIGASVAARGARCAVLGSGGSARAAVQALREGGAVEIRVVSRRALSLPGADRALAWSAQALADCTLIVGCIPPQAAPPPLDRVPAGAHVLDLVYYRESALAAAARARGLRVEDGTGVLVRQGARALELWTGRRAPIDVMWKAVQDAKDHQLQSP